MIPTTSLKEVKIAWDIYNNMFLPLDEFSMDYSMKWFKDREVAWKDYCKVRDHYLYSLGKLPLHEINRLYYPQYKTGVQKSRETMVM